MARVKQVSYHSGSSHKGYPQATGTINKKQNHFATKAKKPTCVKRKRKVIKTRKPRLTKYELALAESIGCTGAKVKVPEIGTVYQSYLACAKCAKTYPNIKLAAECLKSHNYSRCAFCFDAIKNNLSVIDYLKQIHYDTECKSIVRCPVYRLQHYGDLKALRNYVENIHTDVGVCRDHEELLEQSSHESGGVVNEECKPKANIPNTCTDHTSQVQQSDNSIDLRESERDLNDNEYGINSDDNKDADFITSTEMEITIDVQTDKEGSKLLIREIKKISEEMRDGNFIAQGTKASSSEEVKCTSVLKDTQEDKCKISVGVRAKNDEKRVKQQNNTLQEVRITENKKSDIKCESEVNCLNSSSPKARNGDIARIGDDDISPEKQNIKGDPDLSQPSSVPSTQHKNNLLPNGMCETENQSIQNVALSSTQKCADSVPAENHTKIKCTFSPELSSMNLLNPVEVDKTNDDEDSLRSDVKKNVKDENEKNLDTETETLIPVKPELKISPAFHPPLAPPKSSNDSLLPDRADRVNKMDVERVSKWVTDSPGSKDNKDSLVEHSDESKNTNVKTPRIKHDSSELSDDDSDLFEEVVVTKSFYRKHIQQRRSQSCDDDLICKSDSVVAADKKIEVSELYTGMPHLKLIQPYIPHPQDYDEELENPQPPILICYVPKAIDHGLNIILSRQKSKSSDSFSLNSTPKELKTAFNIQQNLTSPRRTQQTCISDKKSPPEKSWEREQKNKSQITPTIKRAAIELEEAPGKKLKHMESDGLCLKKEGSPLMYSCSTCHKSYLSGYSLSRHEARHLGVYPFYCKRCSSPKGFVDRWSLRRHERRVHKIRL